jgi:hypothetical protein
MAMQVATLRYYDAVTSSQNLLFLQQLVGPWE